MPNPTTDFISSPAYQEAVQGATTGNPIYIGTQEWFNSTTGKPRYSRGLKRELTANDTLSPYKEDINKNGQKSSYYGCVFYPEKTPGVTWSYEENKAFIAGVIDANRAVILVTDISHYTDFGGVTTDELFWLKDNGYIFETHPTNKTQTIAKPPSQKLLNNQIKDYKQGKGADANPRSMKQELDSIKNQVFAARANIDITPTISSSYRQSQSSSSLEASSTSSIISNVTLPQPEQTSTSINPDKQALTSPNDKNEQATSATSLTTHPQPLSKPAPPSSTVSVTSSYSSSLSGLAPVTATTAKSKSSLSSSALKEGVSFVSLFASAGETKIAPPSKAPPPKVTAKVAKTPPSPVLEQGYLPKAQPKSSAKQAKKPSSSKDG